MLSREAPPRASSASTALRQHGAQSSGGAHSRNRGLCPLQLPPHHRHVRPGATGMDPQTAIPSQLKSFGSAQATAGLVLLAVIPGLTSEGSDSMLFPRNRLGRSQQSPASAAGTYGKAISPLASVMTTGAGAPLLGWLLQVLFEG